MLCLVHNVTHGTYLSLLVLNDIPVVLVRAGPVTLAFVGDLTSLPSIMLGSAEYRLSAAPASKSTLLRLIMPAPVPKPDSTVGENSETAFRRSVFNRIARGGDLVQAVALVQLSRLMHRQASKCLPPSTLQLHGSLSSICSAPALVLCARTCILRYSAYYAHASICHGMLASACALFPN
jgi:hypothetical protein